VKIDSSSFFIKLSIENIRDLLKIGEKIDASILKKLGSGKYTLKIKGHLVDAVSNMEFKKGDNINLIVEKLKPAVILKLVTPESSKDFVPLKTKLKIPLLKNHKILNKNSSTQMKDEFKNLSEQIKNAVDVFRESSSPIKADTPLNFFIQIPVAFKDKEYQLYIQKENLHNNNTEKKGVRIVVYAETEKFKNLKIDAFYSEGKTSCTIFTQTQEGFDKLNQNLDALQKIVGKNVKIKVDILREYPRFFQKQIDLKI